eukprot:m.76299 g.76299  ORF g.76299 m.76299 type:complete len:221 (-) comp14020_c0_seq1:135-797(-)
MSMATSSTPTTPRKKHASTPAPLNLPPEVAYFEGEAYLLKTGGSYQASSSPARSSTSSKSPSSPPAAPQPVSPSPTSPSKPSPATTTTASSQKKTPEHNNINTNTNTNTTNNSSKSSVSSSSPSSPSSASSTHFFAPASSSTSSPRKSSRASANPPATLCDLVIAAYSKNARLSAHEEPPLLQCVHQRRLWRLLQETFADCEDEQVLATSPALPQAFLEM